MDDLLENMDEPSGIQEAQTEVDTGASGKKGLLKRVLGNKRRLIILLVLLLILGLSGAGALFFFSGTEPAQEEAKVQITDADVKAALEQPPEIVFEDIVVLQPFERIPLKGGSAMQLISLTICLELTDHRYRKSVVAVEDRLRKIVQGQVQDMAWMELRNPEGKLKLKYELLQRMNGIFPKPTVRNVYFSNFLMQ